MSTLTAPPLSTVTLDDGMTLAYRELGSGPPVLLLHGWPTSSFLWRKVMPAIARRNCVIALDLPGFGGSDKPVNVRYDFDFYERALDGFLGRLEMDSLGIAVHDLGGPIALHWMMCNPGRVTRLALLNTLVYPEIRPDLVKFLRTINNPDTRDQLTGPEGLAGLMRSGLRDADLLTDELLGAVLEPYRDPSDRLALALATTGLQAQEFARIGPWLPSLDLPQAEVTALPDCGHFLQEEAAERVGELLGEFFSADRVQ